MLLCMIQYKTIHLSFINRLFEITRLLTLVEKEIDYNEIQRYHYISINAS